MGGFIMKKILSVLLLLVILGGTVESIAVASYDEVPKITRTFSMPIDPIQHLK